MTGQKGAKKGAKGAKSEKEPRPNFPPPRRADAKPPQTKSKKAGLQFPVHMFLKKFRNGRYASRVNTTSAVYITAVLEYLVAEILELAGNAATDHKKRRINPRHLLLAIRNDEEMDAIMKGITLSEGGVLPKPESELQVKKSTKASE